MEQFRGSPMDIDRLVTTDTPSPTSRLGQHIGPPPPPQPPSPQQQHRAGGVNRPILTRISMAPQCPRGGNYSRHATILLVGTRGAGKTMLGKMAAIALGRTFIDLDEHVANTSSAATGESSADRASSGVSPREYAEAMMHLLARYPRHAIISCGNRIIETSECQAILPSARSMHPIVCILRASTTMTIDTGVAGAHARPHYSTRDEDCEATTAKQVQVERVFLWCASHCFFNVESDALLPRDEDAIDKERRKEYREHPLFFKSAADSFLRLMRQIIGTTRAESVAGTFPDYTSLQVKTWSNVATEQTGCRSVIGGDVEASKISAPPRTFVDMHRSTSHHDQGHALWARPEKPQRNECEQHASLPCRADVTSRSSLLTRKTIVLSSTFPDLKQVSPELMRDATQGVDAIELRVDFLACLTPLTRQAREERILETPHFSVKAVIEQLELLRRMAPGMPILFTVRSTREGGLFFDDRNLAARETASPHSQAIYFRLLEIAIATGVELIDIELGWDPLMTRRVVEARGRTKIVMSYHDLTGAMKWDTPLPHQLYERAQGLGGGTHIVHIFSTTTTRTIAQNAHLASTLTKMNLQASRDPSFRRPPILAVNMGRPGQWTRTFNDVMNFVTHPSMPVKAGPGQMPLRSLFETSVRLSTMQRARYHIAPSSRNSEVKSAVVAAFDEYAMPADLCDWDLSNNQLEAYITRNQVQQLQEWNEDFSASPLLNNGLFLPVQHEQQRHLYDLLSKQGHRAVTLSARVVGAVDVIAREDYASDLLGTERATSPPSALSELQGPVIGCHTLPAAVYRVLRQYLAPHNAPTPDQAALVVVLDNDVEPEAGGVVTEVTKRAALFATAKLGFGKVYIFEGAQEKNGNRRHGAGWISDVAELIERSTNDVLEPRPEEVPTDTSSYTLGMPQTREITLLESLDTFGSNERIGSIGRSVGGTDMTQMAVPGTAASSSGSVSDIQAPCALVLVGGSMVEQQAYLAKVWPDVGSSKEQDKGGLPNALLAAKTGGTIMCLPSHRKAPFGVFEPCETVQGASAPLADTVTGTKGEVGVGTSEWIAVHPCVVERDRVQTGVVEAWMRRSAPVERMRRVWQA